MNSAILLVSCPDRAGLVATITQFIYSRGGNILHLDQHVDAQANVFFMRVEWDLARFTLPPSEISHQFEPLAKGFDMRWQLHFSDRRLRMAVFVSRESHALYDLLSRWQSGDLPVDIPCVVGNHRDLEAVVRQFGIAFHHIPVEPGEKQRAEQQQLAILDEQAVDLVVLAKYMQILTPDFIARYPQRIINIHHSFLPAFVGAKPYHQAFERGVKIIGATSHYVTEDLDAGPIIEQDVTRVTHKDSIADLVRRGKDLEKTVLSRAVYYHVQHRVLVYNNKTIVFS
jgi:formyltetrahydrofolate deformylase